MKLLLLSLLLVYHHQSILAQLSHTCELGHGEQQLAQEHPQNQESTGAGLLGLSSGATQRMAKDIVTTFTCEGKKYGYYADMDNDCHIYHVCHPSKTEFGEDRFVHYSFFCNDGTFFDQENTICVPETHDFLTKCKQSHLHWAAIERKFAEQPKPIPSVQVVEKVIQTPIEHHIPQPQPVSHIPQEVKSVHQEVVTGGAVTPIRHTAIAFSNAPVCCFLVPSCSTVLPTACPPLKPATHISNEFVRVLPSHPVVNSDYIRPAARITRV